MATLTWISAANANWTAANTGLWSDSTVPTATDAAVFDGAAGIATLTFNTTVASVDVIDAASTLQIGGIGARTLTVTGNTNLSDGNINFVVSGTNNRTINTDTATISGGQITLNASQHTFNATNGITFSGGTISGLGTVSGDISGTGGQITATSATSLTISDDIAGSNNFTINNGALLTLSTATSVGSSTFDFAGATGTLCFGAGTALTLSSVAIDGFKVGTGAGDQTTVIDFLDGVNDIVSAKFNNKSDLLTVTLSTGVVSFQLNGIAASTRVNFDTTTDTVFLTDTVCYAAGTRIRTDRGDVTVEDLLPGDTVVVLDGGSVASLPVKWIGTRQVDLAAHPSPEIVAPVRIARGAFAENVPARDLVVSPPHAIFIDGKLVPAKLLVNDMTITRAYDMQAVTYYHVELDRHAVILAENLPAESYLDTGNRSFFRNAPVTSLTDAEYRVHDTSQIWEDEACAPLAVAPADVRPCWQALTERAEALGHVRPDVRTTTDADLHLTVAGRRIDPIEVVGRTHRFVLPRRATNVRLASRATAPSRINGWHDEQRVLGVALRTTTIRTRNGAEVLPADHPALSDGWHAAETQGQAIWRWTNGNAALPVAAMDEAVIVEVQLADTTTYILAEQPEVKQGMRMAA
jgi:hypothetical protein